VINYGKQKTAINNSKQTDSADPILHDINDIPNDIWKLKYGKLALVLSCYFQYLSLSLKF
jgi:hypothetical protein